MIGNLQYTHRYEQGDKGERFTYDADNQLKSVLYNANAPWTTAPTGYDRSVSYTYGGDRLNRTGMNDNGAMTYYTPNGLNQYTAVTGEAPVYNGNFHLYSFDGWTYMYDADARLTSATASGHSAAFVYDGLGRCVKRTIDGMETFFTYDGWKPIVEWNSTGSRIAFNIYGIGADEILTRYQVGVGYTHYKSDRLGNVQFLLSETNGGIEKYSYDAFGKPKITDWAGNVRTDSAYGNRFMFTGREYLSTLGIYDYRARHYHPGLGRFLQTDPIGFGGGDNNLFRYCANNPANLSDPMGTSAPGPWTQHRFGGGIESEPGVSNSSFFGAGGVGDGMMGYDGNAGAGLYVFNQGNVGINMGGGVVYGGPANRNGYSYNGKPVFRATAVNGSGSTVPAVPKVLGAIGDVIGKIWSIPNTVIGLAFQIVQAPFAIANGGGFQLANNAIQLVGSPFGRLGDAITFGNTQTYFNATQPSLGGAYRNPAAGNGLHEQGHTYQYQTLGIFFLPAYFLAGHPFTLANPFEAAAQSYAIQHGPPPGG